MKMRSSPKLALASAFTAGKPSSTSLRVQATRMHAAAAAGRGLDHHRIADALGNLDGVGCVVDLADVARHHRDAGLGGELLRLDLVAHGLDGVRVGTDEDDPLLRKTPREARVFTEESEPRMHRLGARRSGHRAVDDLVGQPGSDLRRDGGEPMNGSRRPSPTAIGIWRRPPNRPPRRRSPSARQVLMMRTAISPAVGDQDFFSEEHLTYAFESGFTSEATAGTLDCRA